MPATIQTGIRIVWGSGFCPELPAGYTLVRGIKQAARARNAAGEDFVIALHPKRLAKLLPNGRADFTHAIFF
jgi:hypothetical protein